MTKLFALSALALSVAGSAHAQTAPPVREPVPSTGPVIQGQQNNTGNDPSVSVSRGATGAGTATTDSAGGGNAGQPERAVPQGGSSGSGSR